MIIENGRIITWNKDDDFLINQALLIQDGIIKSISSISDLKKKYPDEKTINANNQIVMPGNICAHTHFYGAFSRGMAIPGEAPSNFLEILQNLWWKLDKALDEEGIRYSTLVCLIDAIKHGTTSLIDHHASPKFIDGSLDVIAHEIEKSGLRAALSYEVTDRDGLDKATEGIEENRRFIERVLGKQGYSNRIRAHFGLHASLTLSTITLNKARAYCPDEIGFHTHIAEDLIDQIDSVTKYGKRVIHRFLDAGILNSKAILAHGVHLDLSELEVIRNKEAWVTLQPRSNMNNAVGVAPLDEMNKFKIKIGFGNDGFSNSMWEEWKTAYLIHKDHMRDPRFLNGNEIIKIAANNNSDLMTEIFGGLRIGEISEGAAADLIFVDYKEYTPLNKYNLPWHILFGFRDSQVTSTLVNGEFLMKDKELLTLDEEKISSVAKKISKETWKRVAEM